MSLCLKTSIVYVVYIAYEIIFCTVRNTILNSLQSVLPIMHLIDHHPPRQAAQGDALLSVMSGVHSTQSGTLVLFLLQEMLCKPRFLHLSHALCSLLSHRLKVLLSPAGHAQFGQISPKNLAPFTSGRYAKRVSSRFVHTLIYLV